MTTGLAINNFDSRVTLLLNLTDFFYFDNREYTYFFLQKMQLLRILLISGFLNLTFCFNNHKYILLFAENTLFTDISK